MDSEGNSGRMLLFIERPTISPEMWEALKSHIMRERGKEEQEAMERERELKRQQELEEVKRELAHLEKRLQDLKDEKHLCFVKLKQVLQEEEEDRRRALELAEARAAVAATHNYANTKCFSRVCGQPGQPSYLQSGTLAPYMMAIPQSTSTAGAYSSSLKRRQSPSPYLSSSYQAGHQTPPPTYKPRLIAHGSRHIPHPTLVPSNSEASRAYYGAHYNTSGNDCPGRQSATAEIAYPSRFSAQSPSPPLSSFSKASHLTYKPRVSAHGSQHAPTLTLAPSSTEGSRAYYGAHHNTSGSDRPRRPSSAGVAAYPSQFSVRSPSPPRSSFSNAGYQASLLTHQTRDPTRGSQHAPHPTASLQTTQGSPFFYGARHNTSGRECPDCTSTTDGVAYSSQFAIHSTTRRRCDV